jgi:hypothetical protein
MATLWIDERTGIGYEMDEIDLPADVTAYHKHRDGERACSCCGRYVPLFAIGVCGDCALYRPGACWHTPEEARYARARPRLRLTRHRRPVARR